MADVPGVIGRYQVLRKIGHGGMGSLYLATDTTLHRQVAIKVLRDAASSDLQERFTREARIAANLHHANIVAIYDAGPFDGGTFIAMEYVVGETLAKIISERAPLPLARKLEIARDMCAGIGHAHSRGIIHRDIKPANVMVDATGVTKILDFGIARAAGPQDDSDAHTQVGTVIGSLNYISPEQLEGRAVDHRSDIFGAGAVLYELLTYRKAFSAPDMTGIVAMILQGAPPPLSTILSDAPPGVSAIVNQALARDPERRYQAIDDMARDLDRLRAKLPADLVLPPVDAVPPPQAAPSPAPAPPPAPAPSMASGDQTVLFSRPKTTAPAPPPPLTPPPAAEPESGHTVILKPAVSPAPAGDARPDVQVLVVRSADSRRRGHAVRVASDQFTIGRGAECTLQLDDPMLSREHAAIRFGPAGFSLHDAGSTNGTFLNGRRLKSNAGEPLYFGATVELGDTVLTFALSEEVTLPDLTGALVAQRYELTRLIRHSAKGAVYAGRDVRVAKTVAVKLMSPNLMRFEGYREQFDREAAVGATLHHPHICQVLDRGEDDVPRRDGSPLRLSYLCLELMSGGSLQQRIREGVVPLDQTVDITQHIADALDYAHRHEVVHGDVKPGAIVFSEDGHVYLTDFAFAQRTLNAGDGPTLGAPAFVAPEVWEHGQMTAASDQFGLAVVAYYAIAGSLPFAGQENPAVRRKNFMVGPVPAHVEAASYRKEAVPRQLSDVLARAMSTEPPRRFESVSAFARALAGALGGRRTAAAGAPQVFLSYQRDMSAGWANYFARELKDRGISTFLDVQRLDRAQQFPARLSRAIEDCDVFVCLLGGTTLQSAWVVEEIRQAHRYNKPMIPIFQESFDPSSARDGADPAVETLLTYDAVHLFDVLNVHVEHSAADLATLITNTIARGQGS